MSSRARAFSLIEVMVSLAIAGILLATLTQIVVDANRAGRRTRVRAELANAGVIATTMLKNDLGAAGLGVPSAVEEASLSKAFGSAVLVAATSGVGIVGDLARPDANYNTFGFLVDANPGGGNDHHVTWLTENNGTCVVGSGCDTAAASTFFPGDSGCNEESDVSDRTCPWGLKRLRGGEPFQVVAGNRRWFSATNKATPEAHKHTTTGLFIHTGSAMPGTWDNNGPSSLPNAGAGQGWVTTLDRVFWRYNSATRTLERIQCWGAPDPTQANWPVLTSTTVPATPCAAPFQGMAAYETVAKNVDSVVFTYFDGNDVAVTSPNSAALKAAIRRIEFRILFRRTVGTVAVEHEAVGGVFLSGAL